MVIYSQSWKVKFKNPTGDKLSWIVSLSSPEGLELTPETLEKIKTLILEAHGNYWKDISIYKIKFLGRTIVLP